MARLSQPWPLTILSVKYQPYPDAQFKVARYMFCMSLKGPQTREYNLARPQVRKHQLVGEKEIKLPRGNPIQLQHD